MVSFHAVADKIIAGTTGGQSCGRRQCAVGILVKFAIAQFHESAAESARLRATAAVLDVLGMVFRREDQLAVITQTRTTPALVILKYDSKRFALTMITN